jgi:hypothetical protein
LTHDFRDGSVDELLSRLAQAAAAGSGGGGAHCSSSTGTDGLGALFSGVGAAGTGAEKPRSGRPTERGRQFLYLHFEHMSTFCSH